MTDQPSADMPVRRRRWPRRFAWGLLGLLGLILLPVLVIGALLTTESGTRWAINTAAKAVPEVSVGRVEGTALDRLTLRGLAVADDQGVWLEAESLTLDWRPSALFGGTLAVEALTGRGVVVARPPVAAPAGEAPAEETGGGLDPWLLTHLSLRALDIDRLTLGGPLLGMETDLTLSAEGAVTGESGAAVGGRFAVRRIGAPGEAELRFAYRPGETLRLDAAAHAPQGGTMAALLGLPDQPALRVSVNGEGPVENWEGRLLAEAEDVATVEADLSLSLGVDHPGQGQAGLSGVLSPGAKAPPALAALARPEVRFSARLRRTAEALRIEALDVSSGGWSLNGQGRLEADDTLAGRATATVERTEAYPQTVVEALAGLPLGGATLSAEVSGTAAAPRVTATLDARDTVVAALSAQAEARFDEDIAFDLRGRLDGISEDMPQLAPIAGAGLDFVLAGQTDPAEERVTVDMLTVTAEAGSVEGRGTVDLAPLDISADLTATMRDLSVLAPLARMPIGGAGRVTASLRTGAEGLAQGPVQVRLTDFALGQPMADRLLAGAVDLRADVALDETGVALSDLSLTAPGASASGRLALSDWSQVDGRLDLAVPSLERLEVGLSGGAAIGADLAGSLEAPEITGTATLPEGAAQGVALQEIAAAFTLTSEALEVGRLDGRVAGAPLSGAVTVDFAAGLLDGQMDLDLGGTALDAYGVAFDGPAALSVVLAPRDGTQGLRATFEGEAVSVADTVAARGVAVEADLRDLFAAPAGTLSVDLGVGTAGGLPFERVALSGRLEDQQVRADLQVRGTKAQPFEASAEAGLALDVAPLSIRLNGLDIAGRGHRLALAAPTSLTLPEAGGLALAETRLTIDDAEATLALDLGARRVTLDLDARRVPLDILALVQPDLPVEGRVDLMARLDGPPGAPEGRLSLQAPDLRLPDAEIDGLAVEAEGTVAEGGLRATVALRGIGEEPARVTARLPLAFTAQGVPSVPADGPLEVTADWQGPVEAVWALVPQVGHRLSGQAVLDARVEGTLEAPRFSGQGRLRGGAYENLEYGTVLRNLDATADLQADGSVQLAVSASDGGNGRIDGEGRLTTAAEGGANALTGRLELTQATLIRRDDLTATLGGTLSYDGSLEAGTLSGDLRTQGAEIDLGGTLGAGGAAALNVVEVNREALPAGAGRAEASEEAAPGEAFGGEVTLEVGVSIPNQVFVRGQGLDSEWKGDLRVGGTLADPRIGGTLQVVRGSYDLIGKSFVLERGVIDLRGGERVNPGLDVRAVHDAGDLTAIVLVGGTADRPEITLESQPALPRDEVLARTLFGRGMADLGPAQAVAVARAATQLAGGGGGGALDITGRLRSGLGLDVLSFGGSQDGASVEAGKYVAEDVYVGVEQGAGAETGAVNVEVELTPRVTVKSKTAGSGESDIGVEWKFNY